MQRLSTVTFSQSVPLRKEGADQIMLDTIQTYYDQTEDAIKGLMAKFPGTHFQIEAQRKRLDLMHKIETVESFRAITRYPSMAPEELEKFRGQAGKPTVKNIFAPKPKIEKPEAAPAGDYAGVVNELMKDAS